MMEENELQQPLKLFNLNSRSKTEYIFDDEQDTSESIINYDINDDNIITESNMPNHVTGNTSAGGNIIELESLESENARLKAELRRSHDEKEALLREVHHRVKNNLQLIISMLNLQSSASTEKQAKKELKAAQGRIRSLALTHQHLYKSRDLGGISVEEYLYGLSSHILTAEGNEQSEKIRIKVSGACVYFPLETAVPFGLLINELVTHSIKGCSESKNGGEIRLKVSENSDGSFTLLYSDGIAANPLTVSGGRVINSENCLIDLLMNQLEGTIEDISSGDLRYKINFRGSNYLSRLSYC